MQENGFLNEEQKMVRTMVRDFCEREIAPVAAEIDEGRFPAEVVKSMGELGLMGLTVPDSYGGGGADPVSMALATEEVAAACPSTSAIFAAHNSLVCEPVYRFGSEGQKEKFLRGLASGSCIGAFALTEPGAGSDAASLTTTAVREGDAYRINGVKRFITSGKQSGLCLLFAVTDRAMRHKGLSAFLVPRDAEGFEVVRSEDKMGMHGCSISELRFDAVELPEANRMGEEGQGFELAMRILDSGRIIVAAQGLGFARACLDASVAYARERETFGVPIKDHQPVAWKLTDMAVRVHGARLLTLKAARLKAAGAPYSAESAIAKVFATDAAQRNAEEGVQLHGGNGYMREYPVERFYRASKVTQIYEGTNEILRQVIAKHLLN